ncbi:MAG TPA: pectate lyase [Opitutaceae bacterium]|nr:pectate lyase [Opitutaceae bacterium]
MKTTALFCGALALLAAPLHAANEPLAAEARAAMEKSTAFIRSIATEGGYLWRYSTDLKERAGENVATPTQIWVQPPGTPSMGMAFLRAHEATGDARYLEAARDAATALAIGQLESGGWDYLVEFDPKLSVNWYRRSDIGKISAEDAAKRKNVSTYDDDNTQSALRFLLALADVTKSSSDPRDVRIREARDYALKKLLEAQRPNGGWPQRWSGVRVNPAEFPVQPARYPQDYPREQPPRHNYYLYYTLNDNTQRDCVMTLLDAAKKLNKPEFRAAALRGGDFLLLAQMPEPQPVWAQQYNPQLEPAWARAFEPPSVCSGESSGAMRLLVDLYLETGDKKYLEPMPRAIAWFKRSEIRPGTWARMYELETNKPVYGDRDGKFHYTLEELTEERRTGYSWQNSYGIPAAIAYYEEVASAGRDAILARRKAAEAKKTDKVAQAKALEPRVREILSSMDAQGRWIGRAGRKATSPQITMQGFIANLRTLADYVEATK